MMTVGMFTIVAQQWTTSSCPTLLLLLMFPCSYGVGYAAWRRRWSWSSDACSSCLERCVSCAFIPISKIYTSWLSALPFVVFRPCGTSAEACGSTEQLVVEHVRSRVRQPQPAHGRREHRALPLPPACSPGRVCHFKSADIHLPVLDNSYDRMYL